MVITPEVRAALVDGSAYGLTSVASAPKHFQDRIVEIRAALAEKRDVPQPSREYQTRSLAAGHFTSKVFRTPSLEDIYFQETGKFFRLHAPVFSFRSVNKRKDTLTPAQMADLSRRSGVSVATLQLMETRSRAKRLGEAIKKDAQTIRNIEYKRVETMTADEQRRAYEKVMGW
jgi:hypothetical protein